MDIKRFVILGTGSIGFLFAAKLALDHHNITCLISKTLRKQYPQFLHFIENNGEKVDLSQILTLKTELNIELEHIPIDYLIIASKATHLDNICHEYHELLDRVPVVYLLQNGLGNEEIVQKVVPTKNIYRIVTSHGSMRTDEGIKHTGTGPTSICLLNPINASSIPHAPMELVQILTHTGIECKWADNPQEIIWRKAFINISINVFGALTRLINGDLPTVDGMTEIMEKTFREAYLVAEQLHINLFPAESYLESVRFILKNAGRNKNSMLQDILVSKTTEIDFLNGQIVQYGKMVQIPTPYNQCLTVLVKGLEKSLKKTN